jgi:RNA polymerase sigma-70 factor, ECF subfamily
MNKHYEKYSDSELFAMMHGKKRESEAAFAELYSRYSQKVFSYCLRMLGNQEDAKDVFQETFIILYKSREQHLSMEHVFSFIITTARHICLNHNRDRKPSSNIDDYKLSTTDVGYEQKELLEIIAQALDLVTFDHKEIFILRLYHGLSYKEISQITGDTETSVKSKFWRAKKRIKKILNPYLNELSKI